MIRIGGGQGFYGDGKAPLAALLESRLDYVVCEALAELTLAIMQKDRQRDESLGYARDLPAYVGAAVPYLLEGTTKFITNAGGINPIAAARAVVDGLKAFGIEGLRVATVVGDDVMGLLSEQERAESLFANAYLGAQPIVQALREGADIVITGRVADASLFLAPLIYEFDWRSDDWDLLAAGVCGGHLLECSGQVTGGNYSGDWWTNQFPTRIGFPIGEFESDGSFVITKPDGTGGMVTFDTVREQLLYETHDPRCYLNPDVTLDLTSVRLTDVGNDRVRVDGIRGSAPPATYKALRCRPQGFSNEVRFAYGWPDAHAKARWSVRYLKQRAEELGIEVTQWCEEYFGVNAFGGPTVPDPEQLDPPEVIGRIAWACARREDAARLAGEVGVLGLSGPPMVASAGRARDGRPSQLLAIEAFAVERAEVDSQVRVSVI